MLERINARFDDIAKGLEKTEKGLALLALGSSGREQERLDQYSDLDFFALVEPGSKAAFLEDLGWLQEGSKLVWSFLNTDDGYKVLWEDGLYGEFAVFETFELPKVPYTPGRMHWYRDESLLVYENPTVNPASGIKFRDEKWLTGEVLSCLYVGTTRCLRGEKLSGWRFIMSHAFSMLLEIWEIKEGVGPDRDPFTADRRFETNHPGSQEILSKMLSGYANPLRGAREMTKWILGADWKSNALGSKIDELTQLSLLNHW